MLQLKRMICLLVCLCIVLLLVPFDALADDGVTEIYTAEDFFAIMDDPYGHYSLEEDIYLGDIAPLGFNSMNENWSTRFSGTLDGNGHTVTYNLHYTQGCNYYGLFWTLQGAQIYNVHLNAWLDIAFPVTEEDQRMSEFVGAVAGFADGSTLGGVFVSGGMNVYADGDGLHWKYLYAAGLVGSIDETDISMCQVDMPVQIRAQSNWVEYYGLTKNYSQEDRVYYCGVSGDANIHGGYINATLLHYGRECVSEQNVYLEPGGTCYLTGADGGSGNLLLGEYMVYRDDPEVNWEQYAYIIALANEENSIFEGSLYANCSGGDNSKIYCYGTSNSNFCSVYADVTAHARDGEGVVEAHGLLNGSDNQFVGNVEATGWSARAIGASQSQRSSVQGDVSVCGYNADAYGLCDSEQSFMEGNLYGSADGWDEYADCDLEGIVGGTECLLLGDITVLSTEENGSSVYGIMGSNDSIMEGNLNGRYDDSVVRCISNSNGCCFSGTAVGYEMDPIWSCNSCMVEADVRWSGWGRVISFSDNCYFKGEIRHTALQGVFYDTVNSCVESNLVIHGDHFGLDKSTYTGNYFIGTIDMYPGGYWDNNGEYHANNAYVESDVPVRVHHESVGTYDTGELAGRSVFVHSGDKWSDYCGELGHVGLICAESLDYEYSAGHYYTAIRCVQRGVFADSNPVTPDWAGGFNPETGEYEEEPTSYTLQVVDPSGNPVENARLLINGSHYYSDSYGCVDIYEGHRAIYGLDIAVEDENGDWRCVKTYSIYYPIPDSVNRIELVMEPEVELTSEAFGGAAQQTGSAQGLVTNIGGLEIPILQLPISLDLEQVFDNTPVQYEYDREDMTGTILFGFADEVPGKSKVVHDEDYKDVVNTLKSIVNNRSNTPAVRAWANEKLKTASARHTTHSMGSNLSVSVMGYAELDQSNFFLPRFQEGGVHGEGDLEGRVVYHLVPWLPPVYVTGALNGELEFDLSLISTEAWVESGSLLTTQGELIFTPGVEMALGVGSRATRMYVEGGGRAELEVSAQFPFEGAQESMTVDATGEIFGEARFMALGGRFSKEFVSVRYWPRQSAAMLLSAEELGEWSVLPRNYAANAVMPISDEGGVFLGLSEENAYPYSQVSIHWVRDSTYLLVYTDDDLTRGAADRSTLRACLVTIDGDGTHYSESVTLDDDGTGDYGFTVKAVDTNAVIVWQDANTAFGDGEGLAATDLAASVELSQIMVDCSGDTPVVTQSGTVAPAGNYPYCPTVYFDGSNACTAWITTNNPDPTTYTTEERETLWLSTGFGEAGWVAVEDQTSVNGIALVHDSLLWSCGQGEETVLNRRDLDGNITEEARGNIRSLQSNGWQFCYVQDEVLYMGDSWENRAEVASGNDLSNLVHMNADCEVFTVEQEGGTSRICQIVGGQALPIGVFEGSTSCYDVGGGQIIALQRTGFTETDTASMHITPVQQVEALEAGELVCSNVTAPAGSSVVLSMEVTNDGYNAVTSLPVEVFAQDGSVLLQQDVQVDILPGDSQWVEVELTIPEGFEAQCVTMNVMGHSRDLDLGGNNLRLDATWTENRPDVIQAVVTNTGLETVTGTVSVDGDSRTVTVEPGQSTEVQFSLGGAPRQEQTVTVTLEEPENTINSEDNQVNLTVHPVKARALRLGSIGMNVGSTLAAQVQAWPAGSVVEDMTFEIEDPSVAQVDGDGNITALQTGTTQITVTATGKRPLSVTAELTVYDGDAPAPNPAPNPDPNPAPDPDPGPDEILFTDVDEKAYYYDSVKWAVEEGITAGTSPTTFAPNNSCTRGQVVSFLWRAAGSPEPKSTYNPFTDVSPSNYFYKAVLWAVEEGITAGTSPTTFAPNNPCTRGQVVSFLWRAADCPTPVSASNSFQDVSSASYYYTAVLWAVEENITSGVGPGRFAPGNTCTRGQIVTFLYRAMTN